jgi:hypothetical protein
MSSDVGIDNPPVLKTDTQEPENLDKAIFSWSRVCKRVLTPAKQTCKHKMTDSGSSLAIVPAPHLGFVQVKGSQSFPIG